MAFFCNQTGVRIVAPGVSKDVDAKNGQDLFAGDGRPENKPVAADKRAEDAVVSADTSDAPATTDAPKAHAEHSTHKAKDHGAKR